MAILDMIKFHYSPDEQQSWAQVQALIERTLEIRQTVLGPEHPLCARTRRYLAMAMRHELE